ncbi:MAG: hypothetical protein P8179_21790 [Candidatus Thiodiazotropha sp.]
MSHISSHQQAQEALKDNETTRNGNQRWLGDDCVFQLTIHA